MTNTPEVIERWFMGRRYNPLTNCWEAPSLTPIPDEKASEVMRPGATMVDLLALCIWKDKRKSQGYKVGGE